MFLRNWYLMNGPSKLVSYYNDGRSSVLSKDAPMLRVYNGQTLGDICTSFTDEYGLNDRIIPKISTIINNSNNEYTPWGHYGNPFYFGNDSNSFQIWLQGNTFSDNGNFRAYFILLGEGMANDSIPVTLDDYNLTNPLIDSDISTCTTSYDRNNGSISITPVLTANKTIREVGIAKVCGFCISDTAKPGASYVTDMANAGFNLQQTSGSGSTTWIPMIFLVYKTKLTTPIQFEAGVPKTITICTDVANM